MATIHKEIEIERSKEFVWDAIRDVGAIHKRLVPGFVVDCKLEGDSRVVWIADLLPNEAAEAIGEMIQHGLTTMKQTLEGSRTGG